MPPAGCSLGMQAIVGGQYRARPGQDALARRGEALKTLAAIDQRQFQFIFQIAQAHGQGRLGNVAACRGTAEVAGFVQGDKEFQLFDVHVRSGRLAGGEF
ncbi:hypothetical protein D3C85_1360190 [compost metagenome]